MFKVLVSLYLLFSLGYCFAIDGEETTENLQFHALQVSSMEPSSTCIPSTKGSGEGTYLKLVLKHGPCSPLFQKGKLNPLSVFQTIKCAQPRITEPGMVSLPADMNYVVTVGIGTLKQQVSLSFDTVSYLNWTQCRSPSGHYFRQNNPLFDPLKSKTFTSIKCSSPLCSGQKLTCPPSSWCGYSMTYLDSSTTEGIYSQDRLTLTSSDVIDNFLFCCSSNNPDYFSDLDEDGMIGLSQNPVSVVQQTAKKHHKVFSYCIPSKLAFTGFE